MRYDRNFNTFSRDDQDRLGQASVVVAGLGGLGGGVIEMLARTGVGRLTGIDGDVFEAHNLNRQLFSTEALIGISKARAAEDRIRSVNSDVSVACYSEFLDRSSTARHIRGADVVMDCLDSIDDRFMLQEAAKNANIPIVSGAIAGVTGQVTVIFPQDPGYELIYGQPAARQDAAGPGQKKGVETQTGNLSYCAMLIAAIQVSECIKMLLNRGDILRNQLLIAELWSNSFEVVRLV